MQPMLYNKSRGIIANIEDCLNLKITRATEKDTILR